MLKFPGFKNNKERQIKFLVNDIEPEEVFLDRLSQEKERELGLSERKMEILLSRKIIKAYFFLILTVLFLFFLKSIQFQILNNKKYAALAEENKFTSRFLEASRGVIYDSQGEQLVFNSSRFDLILNKGRLPNSTSRQESIFKEVSEIINENEKKIKEKAKGKNKIITIKEGISRRSLIILETKMKDLPGFEIRQKPIRQYKNGLIFSHIIGYTGLIDKKKLEKEPKIYSSHDYIGITGLEKYYEKYLRKNPGEILIGRDSRGNIISKKIVSLPKSGNSLVLNINAKLEEKSEESLAKTLKRIGAKKGVVIALDPNNGAVLALVSLPSFNNNLFNGGADKEKLKELFLDKNKEEPFLNRAISGLYPTGSVIKPLIASAALEENIISPNKKIDDRKGYIVIPNKYNPKKNYIKKDWAIHGWVDMRKAIAESCDVYFYIIGGGYKNQIGLGPSLIKKYLELFGWALKTGIDLPGEINGFIPSPAWKKQVKKEPWWDGDTYNLAIGQGDILITPIEVAYSFVAIANMGTLFQPEIVKKIIDGNKKTIKEIRPKIIRKNFIKKKNIEIVREGMREAVTGKNSPLASCTSLKDLPVAAAAKTGTAQIPIAGHYDNWVVVFAPYKNPKIVLLVLIENVKGLQEATLPTAKEILEWYFKSKPKLNTEN